MECSYNLAPLCPFKVWTFLNHLLNFEVFEFPQFSLRDYQTSTMVKIIIWNQAWNKKISYEGISNIKLCGRGVSSLKVQPLCRFSCHLMQSGSFLLYHPFPFPGPLPQRGLLPQPRFLPAAEPLQLTQCPTSHDSTAPQNSHSLVLFNGVVKLTVMKLFLWLFCFGQNKLRSCTFSCADFLIHSLCQIPLISGLGPFQ